jgi:hypothetical protein
MRDNINKVSQRGERLDALQNKTDDLAASAQGFRRGANRVRKAMWWKVCNPLLLSRGKAAYIDNNTGHEDAHLARHWYCHFDHHHRCPSRWVPLV